MLRPVAEADSSLLLAWRNDPDSRRASHNDAVVTRDEHDAWFGRGLNSPDRIMKIAEVAGEAVGVVRADRAAQGWELSWTVAPKSRGQGVGRAMLKAFVSQLKGAFVASIRRDNYASIRMAEEAGFDRVESGADGMFEVWMRKEGPDDADQASN